jgi:hypothetical protein
MLISLQQLSQLYATTGTTAVVISALTRAFLGVDSAYQFFTGIIIAVSISNDYMLLRADRTNDDDTDAKIHGDVFKMKERKKERGISFIRVCFIVVCFVILTRL